MIYVPSEVTCKARKLCKFLNAWGSRPSCIYIFDKSNIPSCEIKWARQWICDLKKSYFDILNLMSDIQNPLNVYIVM